LSRSGSSSRSPKASFCRTPTRSWIRSPASTSSAFRRHGRFGTGYSSLSYLTCFPVEKIKIERSFIDTLGTSPQTSAIVSSIVGLGQSLSVTITAEGVETEGQAARLRKWGCDQVQGFYYGRPDTDLPESEDTTDTRPKVA
jgi:EAL domain-containing protein (putative c-di-GMP-specific phosphodiesterase class I)